MSKILIDEEALRINIQEVVEEVFAELEKEQKRRPHVRAFKTTKATPQVTDRATAGSVKVVSKDDLRVIQTLFAWVANEQDTAPETVQSLTEAKFGVGHVGQIGEKSFDEVVRFLVGLTDEMRI